MALKWLSPEEADGKAMEGQVLWQAISFRIGLLLYCLGSEDSADPHPHSSPDAVLASLLREERGLGEAIRPNMKAYKGTGLVRHLVEECLRLGSCGPPNRSVLMAVLDALAAGVR